MGIRIGETMKTLIIDDEKYTLVPDSVASMEGLYKLLKENKDKSTFKVGNYVYLNGMPCLIKKVWEGGTNMDLEIEGRTVSTATKSDKVRKWTIEDASDDEWVLANYNGDFRFRQAFQVKGGGTTATDVVPYIGQTPKELGLEK